ncbi:MAG TPA: DUF1801 domain-containing protein [bacterium]
MVEEKILTRHPLGKSGRSVDDYLSALPEAVRTTLEKVRQSIKAAAPKAEELISYRIPTYKYLGPLVHFAAFESHCSLIVVNKSIMKIFKKELLSYETSGMTIHFTPDKPLPATLVKKIVKLRIKENEEQNAAKPSP